MWKDILLVVVGGLIGAIPSLTTSCSRQAFERNQMILEHRLAAFKDYSKAYNAGMRIINDEIQQTVVDIGRVTALNAKYDDAVFNPIILDRGNTMAKLSSELTIADAEMATETTVIKSLFTMNIEPVVFVKHANDPALGRGHWMPRENYVTQLQSEMETFKSEAQQIRESYNRNVASISPFLVIGK